jgi:hypothetical protein
VDANSPDPAQTLAVLMHARGQLADPAGWTKGRLALSAHGTDVDLADPEHLPPAKACFVGAVLSANVHKVLHVFSEAHTLRPDF